MFATMFILEKKEDFNINTQVFGIDFSEMPHKFPKIPQQTEHTHIAYIKPKTREDSNFKDLAINSK